MKSGELHLGDVTLALATGHLTKTDGQPIELRHKSREVLAVLVAHQGQIVSKDDLITQVWQKTVVAEEGLVQCVADIRRALGDRNKTIVETIPREGYRLNVTEPTLRLRTGRRILIAMACVAALATVLLWDNLAPRPKSDLPVVAVLRLDDMSRGASHGYLSDVLSEGIITDLARFSQFRVVARNSSFQFRDTPTDIRKIAEVLGADYVLDGSQQYENGVLRVTVQLIDARTGTHVYSDRIDGKKADLFDIQDQIISKVASTIGDNVLNHIPTLRSERELDTILREMQARKLMRHFSRENWEKALALSRTSIRLDPESAWGYIGTSLMLRNALEFSWIDTPRDELLEEAGKLAQQALTRAPENYMSHYAAGRVFATSGEFEKSIFHLERAAELNQSDPSVLIAMSFPLLFRAEYDRAIEVLLQAKAVDPLHSDWLLWQLGWAYWQNNQCEEGIVAMREMSNPPDESFKNLAGLYACAGEIEKSRNAMVRFLESSEDYSILDEQAKTHQIRSEEDTAARWLDHLRVAGLPEN